jgi:CubicO group peptidase (beta-lactamase class C family)
VFFNSEDGLSVPTDGNNHRMQAGSISKTVAALGFLVLIEKNDAISLDDPVNKHLKSWKVSETLFNQPITIRQLLSHTAGLNAHGFPGYKSIKKATSLKEVLSGDGNTDAIVPIFPPDSVWKYSGGGYEVLQMMLEDVTGMTFAQYLQKEVLTPLKMTNSTYELLTEEACPTCAFAYTEKGKRYKAGWYQYPESAAAGLWTTAEDLSTFFIHLGEIYKGEAGVISNDMLTEMITPVKNNYGFGLFIEERDNGLYIGHSGKNRGFTNEALFNLKTQNGVVVLTDSDSGFGLIRDIQRSVPGLDKWAGGEQIVIHEVEIADGAQEKYVGKYRAKDPSGRVYKANVSFKNGTLTAKDPRSGRINVLIPEGEGVYRERRGGTQVGFITKDGMIYMNWGGSIQLPEAIRFVYLKIYFSDWCSRVLNKAS